jgi:hypothetical protein
MTNEIVRAARLSLLFSSLVACAACASPVDSASENPEATTESLASDVEQWRASIVASPSDQEGCFHASFPSLTWEKVECVEAPSRPMGRSGVVPETVGNGNDFAAAVTSGLISQTVGTFPTVRGVWLETDGWWWNTYSIQLNSNFMSGTAACEGVSGCMSWLQYVYSSSEKAAFMQYWLIGIGTCPSGGGWNSYGSDCYKNSTAVTVPTIAITSLSQLKMSGTAVAGGNDTLVFTNGTHAYTTSGADTVADLATAWTASEFNVIGDGGGSKAVFNKGSSVTVNVAVDNGTTNAPKCVANDGTTGETNNLTLGSCSAVGGSAQGGPPPYIQFTESN